MRLSGIVRFPIKSCRGTSVTHAEVGRRGLAHDRRWMIVDAESRFVTQREEHRLSLVDVAIDGDAGSGRAHTMRLGSATYDEMTIPLVIDAGERIQVTVWKSEVDALVHREGSDWFSAFLGRAVRLVYMPDDVERPVSPKRARPGDVVSFADGYPLLLASETSLVDLGDRIERNGGVRVPMERFRPNVIVSGAPAWDEDRWASFSIGEVTFRAPKPCERCVVTTIDPQTAIAGREPLKTLATFRRWALPGGSMGVWFGMNLIPDDVGTLSVGDAITVHTGA